MPDIKHTITLLHLTLSATRLKSFSKVCCSDFLRYPIRETSEASLLPRLLLPAFARGSVSFSVHSQSHSLLHFPVLICWLDLELADGQILNLTLLHDSRISFVPHCAMLRRWSFKKLLKCALAGVAEWIERQPLNQRVTSLIPSQSTCLGCRPGPPSGGCARGNRTLMLLPLSPFPSVW